MKLSNSAELSQYIMKSKLTTLMQTLPAFHRSPMLYLSACQKHPLLFCTDAYNEKSENLHIRCTAAIQSYEKTFIKLKDYRVFKSILQTLSVLLKKLVSILELFLPHREFP